MLVHFCQSQVICWFMWIHLGSCQSIASSCQSILARVKLYADSCQFMPIHISSCQFMLIHANPCKSMLVYFDQCQAICQFVSVHVNPCQFMLIHLGSCQAVWGLVSIHPASCWSMSIHCQLVSAHLGSCQFMPVDISPCQFMLVHADSCQLILVCVNACQLMPIANVPIWVYYQCVWIHQQFMFQFIDSWHMWIYCQFNSYASWSLIYCQISVGVNLQRLSVHVKLHDNLYRSMSAHFGWGQVICWFMAIHASSCLCQFIAGRCQLILVRIKLYAGSCQFMPVHLGSCQAIYRLMLIHVSSRQFILVHVNPCQFILVRVKLYAGSCKFISVHVQMWMDYQCVNSSAIHVSIHGICGYIVSLISIHHCQFPCQSMSTDDCSSQLSINGCCECKKQKGEKLCQNQAIASWCSYRCWCLCQMMFASMLTFVWIHHGRYQFGITALNLFPINVSSSVHQFDACVDSLLWEHESMNARSIKMRNSIWSCKSKSSYCKLVSIHG
jgi:hypothetical protein